MSIQTVCRVCGAEVEADRAAIVAGLWRWCQRCRDEHDASVRAEPPAIGPDGADRGVVGDG
jgi:hypothetical protein